MTDGDAGPSDGARSQERRTALDAYIAKKIEIDTMLACLKALSSDHLNAEANRVTWPDVGTLGHYAESRPARARAAFGASLGVWLDPDSHRAHQERRERSDCLFHLATDVAP